VKECATKATGEKKQKKQLYVRKNSTAQSTSAVLKTDNSA